MWVSEEEILKMKEFITCLYTSQNDTVERGNGKLSKKQNKTKTRDNSWSDTLE